MRHGENRVAAPQERLAIIGLKSSGLERQPPLTITTTPRPLVFFGCRNS